MHCLRLPPIRLIPDANHSAYEENGSRRDKSAPHEQTDSPEGSCRCCLLSRTHFCMFVGGGEGDMLLQEEQGTPSNSGNDTQPTTKLVEDSLRCLQNFLQTHLSKTMDTQSTTLDYFQD